MTNPCPGCGLYYVVHRTHRDDCTANYGPTHEQALANVINVIGIARVVDDEVIE